MFSKHLEHQIVYENDSIYEAFWAVSFASDDSLLIVLDSNQKFLGVCTLSDFKRHSFRSKDEMKNMYVKDIYNKQSKVCIVPTPPKSVPERKENLYRQASYLFSRYTNITALPVIDEDRNVIDICRSTQVFWQSLYNQNKLPRMHYARQIYEASVLARKLNYDKISVIEFGVAGGNGLLNCEFHAQEIEDITGVKIEIYGFDTGKGLPPSANYKDAPWSWGEGFYKMNEELLRKRLQRSKLIIGDVAETLDGFFDEFSPAPIGAMLVDVDYYTSTIPILNMLTKDERYFLPRIYMYFDDIFLGRDCIGENLAIIEFNTANKDIKIAPECPTIKEKLCHKFLHKDYNTRVFTERPLCLT